jgi:hypothetical protein
MSDCIETFFDAWQVEEAELRFTQINNSVTKTIRYDDPRTPETLTGTEALNNYVGMFSANASGWSATVIKSDTIADVTRITVAFKGKGADGSEQVQLGQYFVEKEGDLISRLVGFVGTGELN